LAFQNPAEIWMRKWFFPEGNKSAFLAFIKHLILEQNKVFVGGQRPLAGCQVQSRNYADF